MKQQEQHLSYWRYWYYRTAQQTRPQVTELQSPQTSYAGAVVVAAAAAAAAAEVAVVAAAAAVAASSSQQLPPRRQTRRSVQSPSG